MASRRPLKYQLIQLTVAAAGNTVTPAGQPVTDKLYKRVTGITVTASDAAGLTNSTFGKFEIDKQEIYPVGFEAKLVSTGQEVNPNEKFDADINERAQESSVDIEYTDGSAAGVAYPYTVNVYLRLENTEDESDELPRNKFTRLLSRMFTALRKQDETK